jgi:hypothetical protein
MTDYPITPEKVADHREGLVSVQRALKETKELPAWLA